MKRLIHSFIVCQCVFLMACASTQTKEDAPLAPFSAQGWGGTTCKELIHDITPKNVGFDQAVQNIHLYQSWASGFVSGVNYADSDVYDVSGATTPEDTFAWLNDYCGKHPDVAIPIALHELIAIWEQEGKVLTKANH